MFAIDGWCEQTDIGTVRPADWLCDPDTQAPVADVGFSSEVT